MKLFPSPKAVSRQTNRWHFKQTVMQGCDRGRRIGQAGGTKGEKKVDQIIPFLRMVAVLVAAAIVGNMFLTEVKKNRLRGAKWYKPYLSLPGLVVVAAVALPLFVWWLTR